MEDFELLEKIGERLVDTHLDLKNENFRLKQLVDNDFIVPNDFVVSFVIDKSGFFVLPNKKFLKVFGVKAKELKTKDAFEFFGESPQAAENIRLALRGKALTDVLRLDNKYWKVTYQPRLDEISQVIDIAGISVDVTDIINNPEKFRN